MSKTLNEEAFLELKKSIKAHDHPKVLALVGDDLNVFIKFPEHHNECGLNFRIPATTTVLNQAIHDSRLETIGEDFIFVENLAKHGASTFYYDSSPCGVSLLDTLVIWVYSGNYEYVDKLIALGLDMLQINNSGSVGSSDIVHDIMDVDNNVDVKIETLSSVLFWLSRGFDLSIFYNATNPSFWSKIFDQLKTASAMHGISWDEPFKGGASLAFVEALHKAVRDMEDNNIDGNIIQSITESECNELGIYHPAIIKHILSIMRETNGIKTMTVNQVTELLRKSLFDAKYPSVESHEVLPELSAAVAATEDVLGAKSDASYDDYDEWCRQVEWWEEQDASSSTTPQSTFAEIGRIDSMRELISAFKDSPEEPMIARPDTAQGSADEVKEVAVEPEYGAMSSIVALDSRSEQTFQRVWDSGVSVDHADAAAHATQLATSSNPEQERLQQIWDNVGVVEASSAQEIEELMRRNESTLTDAENARIEKALYAEDGIVMAVSAAVAAEQVTPGTPDDSQLLQTFDDFSAPMGFVGDIVSAVHHFTGTHACGTGFGRMNDGAIFSHL